MVEERLQGAWVNGDWGIVSYGLFIENKESQNMGTIPNLSYVRCPSNTSTGGLHQEAIEPYHFDSNKNVVSRKNLSFLHPYFLMTFFNQQRHHYIHTSSFKAFNTTYLRAEFPRHNKKKEWKTPSNSRQCNPNNSISNPPPPRP